MRDSRGFTVDDPRFPTAWVADRSMLSVDGAEHTPVGQASTYLRIAA